MKGPHNTFGQVGHEAQAPPWAASDWQVLILVLTASPQLDLRLAFIFLLAPLPRGPVEGPDAHFPSEIRGFRFISARIRGILA